MTHLESLTKKLHALLPETRVIIPEFDLEDILKALGILAKAEYLGLKMDCDSSTLLLWWTLMPSGFYERAKEYPWQLSSTLDKQSPELIEWLDNLIPEQK